MHQNDAQERRPVLILAGVLSLAAAVPLAAQISYAECCSGGVELRDFTTGAVIGPFIAAAGHPGTGLQLTTFAADGTFYGWSTVANGLACGRFHGQSGAFLGPFATAPATVSGLPTAIMDVAFGPGGHLYACLHNTSQVWRYDGATGAFLGAFVPPGGGGLNIAEGLTFGPDGHLYVVSRGTHSVKRYDGQTGAFLGDFVPPGSGGLNHPITLRFGLDGHLYVVAVYNNAVHRYDGMTGAPLGTIPTLPGGVDWPHGLTVAPDGTLLVLGLNSNNVARFDPATGAPLNTVAPVATRIVFPMSATPPRFQVNQPAASLALNGAAGSAWWAATAGACSGTLALGTALANPPWELGLTIPEPLVPVGFGGFATAGGQIVNLDLAAPGLVLLNGGAFQATLPLSLAIPFAVSPTAPPVSVQMAVVDPAQAIGLALSAPARLLPGAAALIAGPAGDDSFQQISVAALSSCPGAGVSFCGTTHPDFFVSSNGFVSFGTGSSDPTATVSEFASQMPRLAGAWTNLHPNAGGTISISHAAGVISVSWQAVQVTNVPCTPWIRTASMVGWNPSGRGGFLIR